MSTPSNTVVDSGNNDNNSNSKKKGKSKPSSSTRHERKRAIAGGVTTIALIALGIVIAGAVGAYAFTSMNQSKGGLKAMIESAEIVRSGASGAGTIAVTMKNVGDVAITSASINVAGVQGASVTISDIGPGQTMSGSTNITSGLGGPGTVYTAIATFTGVNGQTMTDTFNVTVEGL